MAKIIFTSSSLDINNLKHRPNHTNIDELESEADRRADEIYQKYLAKIQDGSYTENDFERYASELEQVLSDFTKSCIDVIQNLCGPEQSGLFYATKHRISQ